MAGPGTVPDAAVAPMSISIFIAATLEPVGLTLKRRFGVSL